jgi:hypothetical protein
MPNDPQKPSEDLTPDERRRRLKERFFTPEGREERIARGLRAFAGPKPTFRLTPEEWKYIAESADFEDPT